DEQAQLRSAALQTASSILVARQREEQRREAYLAEAQRLSRTGSFGWKVAAGEIVWSEETFRIFQYDRGTEPTVERVLARVHPEDAAVVSETIARASRDASDFEHAYRLVMPDGLVKHVHVVARGSRDAQGGVEFVGAVMDVTEQQRARAVLAGEKRLLEMVARGDSLATILDALCRLVEELASGSLSSILLLDPNARRLRHGAGPSLPIAYTKAIDGVAIGPSVGSCGTAAYRGEPVIVRDIANDPLWADFRELALAHGLRACWSTPVRSSQGKVLGTFAIYYREPRNPGAHEHNLVEQITHIASIAIERKQAEEALRRSEQRLRQAEKMEAIGRLAGGIAHDFNNILGGILGYGELAQGHLGEDSVVRRYVDQMMLAGARGKGLVERILAFSRSGPGERVPVHVQSAVEEALEIVTASLTAGIRLEQRLDAGDAAVVGDATRLHQVAMNLCTNALQAMEHGGVLTVALGRVAVMERRALSHGTLAPGPHVRLAVSDTGCGIPPAVLERMFDAFFTTKGVGEGTGLGLSLVHGIVADLGGAIDVATQPGAGTTFTVWLPAAGETARILAEPAVELPRGNGEVVMIVDDQSSLVALAEETLAALGYEPAGFRSSVAALQAFRAAPQRFDLVLTDETMPDMSGVDLAREMRRVRPELPVLLMSGYSGAQLDDRARATGVAEVLRKPLVRRDIAEALARTLRSSGASRS
ncbi:MAG TPA: ATP-binding protein, partial [Burkholderiales bacterium]|nr:ATP-binding protein [Burkholderiales bacterium]